MATKEFVFVFLDSQGNRITSKGDWEVMFKSENDDTWLYLRSFPNVESARDYIAKVREREELMLLHPTFNARYSPLELKIFYKPTITEIT